MHAPWVSVWFRIRTALLALVTTAAFSSSAQASVARKATIEGLASHCDAVIRARVVKCAARVSADGRRIFTDATIRTGDVWRGSAPRELIVRTPGGRVGDFAQRVDGAALLQRGEEVVLFLRKAGLVYSVAGLGQGKFTVAGADAIPDIEGMTRVESPIPRDHRVVETMPVVELERRVRSAR